ncbi:ABC transporter substrate-binding protein [Brevibacillus massiliensis]|uniref:ABC transporter substrate-binding protein n=1 Tax=Brevibacillus massiliensis TaxID=1118054 RepID=UPI0002E9FA77|nr:ABC transporter substrate-binding protein [Brevibacillus massiliensis]
MRLHKGLLSVLLASFLVVSGCGSNGQGTPDTSGGQGGNGGEQTLVVVNWKDYGSDDPEMIKAFEESCSCKVVHEYMASEEELLTRLKTGGVGKLDVILPNASILPVAIQEGLLEPIDVDKLENYQYINKTFKNIPENEKDGQVYAVPWVWGSTSIAYNSNVIKDEIDSINVLWDEKYKGQIAFRDDFNDAVMIAAIAANQDPNNPSDMEAVKQKLLEQKPLNRTYWKTGDEFSKLFANNQISIGVAWSGNTAAMKQAGQPIKYVIPKEGAIGWVDNWAIVKDSPHKDLAMKFIDFMIGKDFQTKWVNKGGPAPVNTQVVDNLDPAFVQEMGLDEEAISKLFFISYHTEDEKKAWNELWHEVKAQ